MRRPGSIAMLLLAGACMLCLPDPAAWAEDPGEDEASRAEKEHLEREPWWALGDTKYSRKQVRDMLAKWVGPQAGTLPGGGASIREWIELLDRMIAEDAEHQPPKRPLAELPAGERIAELIFRLRDVTGPGVYANGGPPDVFSIPGLGDPNAADLLVKEGHGAVPALIATLGDDRLTRTVGDPRGGGNPMVWRIGNAAGMILARIAGRPFFPPAVPRGPDFGASLKPVIEAWWAAVREKGEFLAAADELETAPGSYMQVYLSQRLASLDGHAAAPIVSRAARACSDPMQRKLLIDVLAPLKGPGALEFLRHEVEHGPFLLHRVTSAYALRQRGEVKRAEEAMRAAWRAPLHFGSHANTQWARWTVRAGIHQIAAFLASAKDPAVISDLGVGLDKREAPVRAVVAQMLGGGRVEFYLTGYFGVYRLLDGVKTIDDAVARKLLRPLLDDTAATGRHAKPWGAPLDTRVCDLAAAALSRREPGTFRFEPNAKRDARDAAIARIRTALDAR